MVLVRPGSLVRDHCLDIATAMHNMKYSNVAISLDTVNDYIVGGHYASQPPAEIVTATAEIGMFRQLKECRRNRINYAVGDIGTGALYGGVGPVSSNSVLTCGLTRTAISGEPCGRL